MRPFDCEYGQGGHGFSVLGFHSFQHKSHGHSNELVWPVKLL